MRSLDKSVAAHAIVHGHDLEVESLEVEKGNGLMACRPACLLVKRP
jgi:hypothetical protein